MAYKLFNENIITQILGFDGVDNIPTKNNLLVELTLNSTIEQIENYLGRKLVYKEYTETNLIPDSNRLYLKAYPIKEVSYVIPLKDGEYHTENATPADNYFFQMDEDSYYLRNKNDWGNVNYKVIYKGGFNKYLHEATSNDESDFNLPDGLAAAILEQFKYNFERRNNLGTTNIQDQNGNVSIVENNGLLRSVIFKLDPYRRIIL